MLLVIRLSSPPQGGRGKKRSDRAVSIKACRDRAGLAVGLPQLRPYEATIEAQETHLCEGTPKRVSILMGTRLRSRHHGDILRLRGHGRRFGQKADIGKGLGYGIRNLFWS